MLIKLGGGRVYDPAQGISGGDSLSEELRARFEQEGFVFDEEGTSCALSFRNFRGPRNASGRGYEGAHPGTLAITRKSFYVQLPYMLVWPLLV